jgi:NADPH:quinone reductase-like Zn-dependent oxidoreductase
VVEEAHSGMARYWGGSGGSDANRDVCGSVDAVGRQVRNVNGAAAMGQRVVGTERCPTHVICSRYCSLNTSGMCGGRASGNKITSSVAYPCMQ